MKLEAAGQVLLKTINNMHIKPRAQNQSLFVVVVRVLESSSQILPLAAERNDQYTTTLLPHTQITVINV